MMSEHNHDNGQSRIMSHIPENIRQEMFKEQQHVHEHKHHEVKEEQAPGLEPDNGFISDTFQKLATGQAVVDTSAIAPTVVKEEPKKSNNPLDNIVIDVDTVEILDGKSPFEARKDFEAVFNNKPVYQVVAVQSGYTAEMSALSMQDINKITNSNVDVYNHKRSVYQALHKHLEKTSVGKIGFTDFLKMTSYHDYETLLYGVYCQTFPEQNKFEVTCGSCQKQTSLIVNNETLVETHGEGVVMDKILEIVKGAKEPGDLVGKSLVNTTIRTVLPDSKLLLDLQTPSLWDHLEMLRTIDQRVLQTMAETVGTMLFIKNVYMLDVESTIATGRPKYYPIKDRNQILDIISNLSMQDGSHLDKTIGDRIEKFAITYSVKNAKCQHCNDSLGDLPVDMETALFTQISRARRA
jgi:hypothetical protein